MPIIDHIGITVRDYQTSKEFYKKLLQPLEIELVMEVFEKYSGFGKDQKPEFWMGAGEPLKNVHIAFVANDRKTVDAFHANGLKIGGKDNGAPGVRAHYHPNYYGAFIIDPDGYNIEAVCHQEA